eukprot:14057114-Alexandrium_andersonii.AAC.1
MAQRWQRRRRRSREPQADNEGAPLGAAACHTRPPSQESHKDGPAPCGTVHAACGAPSPTGQARHPVRRDALRSLCCATYCNATGWQPGQPGSLGPSPGAGRPSVRGVAVALARHVATELPNSTAAARPPAPLPPRPPAPDKAWSLVL